MLNHVVTTLLSLLLICSILTSCAGQTSQSARPPVASSEVPSISISSAAETLPAIEKAPPDNNWQEDLPENHGMDATLLQSMHTALAPTQILSCVVIKDGVLVDEYYKEGYDQSSIFALNSVSKSVTGTLIGKALDEGLIDGLDVSISEYFPQVRGTDKEAITIRHLLGLTSGIQWYEWGGNSTSFWNYRRSENWVNNILEQPMAAAPGEVFTYTSGGVHLLSAILQQATGMSQLEYARKYLFEPIGIESAQWGADPQGVTDGGNGLSMTARDAAKFGQLYLDNGQWKGQQLISQTWVQESIRQQSPGVAERSGGAYGHLFWIRPFGTKRYDTYYAMGHAGQFIMVTPELKLVTVFTSSNSQSTYVPWSYLSDYILAACD